MRHRFPLRTLVAVIIVSIATAGVVAAQEVRVMTRNLFIGADLNPVLAAQTPAEFAAAVQTTLTQIAASDFPKRAELFADEMRALEWDHRCTAVSRLSR